MNKMFFPVADEFSDKLAYGFAGVGCYYEQEHVKRPGGRYETEWMYPYYQWIQCRRGSGELVLGGKKYTVGEGQGMLLFPNEPHEYYAVTDSWEVDWVVFSGKYTEEFIRDIMGVRESRVYSVTMPHMISELIVKLYETAVSDDPVKYIISSGIVYDILRNIYICGFKKKGSSLSDKAERLRPVFRYIDEHYREAIPLTVLSDLILVTPQHLCVIFKNLTSRTVSEYINSVRIAKSKELLLRERNMQIKEVAALCGFSDVSYFCAMFKRFENISPAEFRGRG